LKVAKCTSVRKSCAAPLGKGGTTGVASVTYVVLADEPTEAHCEVQGLPSSDIFQFTAIGAKYWVLAGSAVLAVNEVENPLAFAGTVTFPTSVNGT
jgi:hypothetical protein